MQLEYFWIRSYRNIKEQEFNLGGKYYYSAKNTHDNNYNLTREENPYFISDFFTINKKGFTNVSAIVGENGSGKTNTLSFIRALITNRFIAYDFEEKLVLAEFVAIFSDSDNMFILPNLSDTYFDYDFECKIINEVPDKIKSIYFHPIYDFSIFPLKVYASDIDVSGNYLLEEDYEQQKIALPEINQADIHKYSDSSRQINFINSISAESPIHKKLMIPNLIDIVIEYNPITNRDKDFWNTPGKFRSFFKLLDDRHKIEINSLSHKENRETELNRLKLVLEIQKQRFVSWSLYYLLRNLFSNIEISNHFLDVGNVRIKVSELNNLSFKNSLIKFIKSQDIFPIDHVLNLIENIEIIGDYIQEFEDGHQGMKVAKVDAIKIPPLQQAYLRYQENLYDIAGNTLPYGFMNFDWHGLSTGEKAYLNLFSRLNYAKQKIYNKIKKENSFQAKEQFPENIILLVDEGEIGFHLQWQKEYIRNLIEIVPLLFEPERPNIQLIFTTHSPISLSDIPQSNVTYIKKYNRYGKVLGKKERPKHSFGANIHDLLHDAFYLNNGFMGDFAEQKIQRAIDWCLNTKVKRGAVKIKKLISLIDEPIIKVKLSEMFAEKMGENVERARLEAQREYIENRLKELNNDRD